MTYQVSIAQLQTRPIAVVHERVAPEDITEFLGGAFEEVGAALAHQGLTPAGPPLASYRPTADGSFEVSAGFPVSAPAHAEGRVVGEELPGGMAAWTIHRGAYDDLGTAYEATQNWLMDNGYVVAGQPWEVYLDEPDVPEPRTEIFFPCQSVRH